MKNGTQSYERYQRQIILTEFGEEGQQKLSEAKLLVVGAGGLGCPALQYLVAAGIGKTGIIDSDIVSINNLHRQVLYTTNDVGRLKAEVAAERLHQMNPDVTIVSYPVRMSNKNALEIISAYDIVLDATDNFATRYLINDACVLLNKPFVYGAISQFEGQVAAFNCEEKSVNYRDLFPQPPTPGSVLNCAEAGVLGVLPGIIGTMQATEVIKLVTGIGNPMVNQLFTYNALTNSSYIFKLAPVKATAEIIPKTSAAFEAMNYEAICEWSSTFIKEIDSSAFDIFIEQSNTTIIDVREDGELPDVKEFNHLKLSLSGLKENISSIHGDNIILFCQSGNRSMEAARVLSASFGSSKKVYSLRGGILQWKKQHAKA